MTARAINRKNSERENMEKNSMHVTLMFFLHELLPPLLQVEPNSGKIFEFFLLDNSVWLGYPVKIFKFQDLTGRPMAQYGIS